uniref:Uncharacterized protein n=1 Tax=Timema shepardi TaxID=629360 RepID=A0A7R9G2D8_TIMSH|nr:unnamed protein product [Timema shepardi]
MASLVLTDSSQLNSDSQHLVQHESDALDHATNDAGNKNNAPTSLGMWAKTSNSSAQICGDRGGIGEIELETFLVAKET